MDLLVPHDNRKILWSLEPFYLVKFRDTLRSFGFLVDTRFPEEPISGFSQRVRVLARMYSARQTFNARHYLARIKELVPDQIGTLPDDFWAYFQLKSDEQLFDPVMFDQILQEYLPWI